MINLKESRQTVRILDEQSRVKVMPIGIENMKTQPEFQ